jgi:periplasmic protein TonB
MHGKIIYSSIHPLLRYLTVRILQLVILCFISSTTSYGQTAGNSYGKIAVEITKQKRPKKIYTRVEITSAFPGGDSVWVKSLENSLNRSIPFRNGAPLGSYVVYVQFVVTKDGSISDVKPLTNHGYGMEAEVVRALKKNTKWEPAPAGGRSVGEYRH